ncbi:MAG: DUF2970 domain-containing protein [Gammaproteobacteria bacterium]
MTDQPDPHDDDRPLTLRETLGSILAAAIGVQSNKNRERDFRRGSARNYIVLGLLATLLFILAVYGAVRLVLGLAGA